MTSLVALRAAVKGEIFRPGDHGYERARLGYNSRIDHHPALIARCMDVTDVIHALGYARSMSLQVQVRAGGHDVCPQPPADGGLVIDLSAVRGVRVNPRDRTVRVDGGCTWETVDHATHAFGLATPGGFLSSMSVRSLVLGAGLGHLTRPFGSTADNLLEMDVVLADGAFVTVTQDERPDMFRALLSGEMLGVITSFVFRLHPVNTVLGGPTLWEMDRAEEVMRWYRTFIVDAPKELNGFFVFLTVPPVAPFPPHLHLRKMCGVFWCYTGPPDQGDDVFHPIGEFGPPALYDVRSIPFPKLQGVFDNLYPPGLYWMIRTRYLDTLSDQALHKHVAQGCELPTMHSAVLLHALHGVRSYTTGPETVPPRARANWAQVIAGVDPDPANLESIRTWIEGSGASPDSTLPAKGEAG